MQKIRQTTITILDYSSASIKAAPSFIWDRIPTFNELCVVSPLMALLKILSSSGNYKNPVADAFLRDFIKLFDETRLAWSNSHFGTSKYWRDRITLAASITKPILKYTIMTGYQSSISSDYHTSKWQTLIQNHTNDTSIKLSKNISVLLTTYMKAEASEYGSRIANIVTEPVIRTLGGVAKKEQDIIADNYQKQSDSQLPLAKDPDFAPYRSEHSIKVKDISKAIQRHAIQTMPYSLSYSVLKSILMDFMGQGFAFFQVSKRFANTRMYFDQKLLSILDPTFTQNLTIKSSFYDRKDHIWKQQNASDAYKYAATTITFGSEFIEKTIYNMAATTYFSPFNKVLADKLYYFYDTIKSPIISSILSVIAGVTYVKMQFFDKKTKQEITLCDFVQKKHINLSSEDKCFVDFVDALSKTNDGSLPTNYDDPQIYKTETTQLIECLSNCNADYTVISKEQPENISLIGETHEEL